MHYSSEACVRNKDIGWRMKECIEANPFAGVKDTGAELI